MDKNRNNEAEAKSEAAPKKETISPERAEALLRGLNRMAESPQYKGRYFFDAPAE